MKEKSLAKKIKRETHIHMNMFINYGKEKGFL